MEFFSSSSSSSSGVIFWRSIFQKPDFLWQKITLLHYYGLDTTYYYGKKYAVVGDNSDGYEAKTASLAYKPMKQLGFSGSIGSSFIHIHPHPYLSAYLSVWMFVLPNDWFIGWKVKDSMLRNYVLKSLKCAEFISASENHFKKKFWERTLKSFLRYYLIDAVFHTNTNVCIQVWVD